MVVIAPEGRMKRATGLDANGNPMTVRGGVADVLQAISIEQDDRVQRRAASRAGARSHPECFQKVRLRVENVDIAGYIAEQMAKGGVEQFKRNVIRDLEQRAIPTALTRRC